MNEVTQQILISLFTGYVTNISLSTVKTLFKRAFQHKPKLENDLKAAKTPADFERIFKEAIGVIDALAGSGSIEIENYPLEALRGIRFDHQNGKVAIVRSALTAPLLQTGGKGSGQTEIIDSTLKSQGTQITAAGSSKIKISGDAQIFQS